MSPAIFGIFGLGPQEMIVIAILGILLFGRKLPEVGRYLGKGIIEFKKGMKGLEDEGDAGYSSAPQQHAPPPQQEAPRPPQRITTSAPKFDDPANPGAPPRI